MASSRPKTEVQRAWVLLQPLVPAQGGVAVLLHATQHLGGAPVFLYPSPNQGRSLLPMPDGQVA